MKGTLRIVLDATGNRGLWHFQMNRLGEVGEKEYIWYSV